MHELAHVLGLDHVNDTTQLMHEENSGTSRRRPLSVLAGVLTRPCSRLPLTAIILPVTVMVGSIVSGMPPIAVMTQPGYAVPLPFGAARWLMHCPGRVVHDGALGEDFFSMGNRS
ncbi:hypothetical protein DQ354_17925 [Arthrobacter sp. AQ5-06]|nr:hypothetical protein DQ354_17925 [Arthrobacter sp. AQ5-06]